MQQVFGFNKLKGKVGDGMKDEASCNDAPQPKIRLLNSVFKHFHITKAASDCLANCFKLSKKLEHPFKSVSEPLAYANDIVNGKLENSKKENDFIYHEKVPDLDSLQEIKVSPFISLLERTYLYQNAQLFDVCVCVFFEIAPT